MIPLEVMKISVPCMRYLPRSQRTPQAAQVIVLALGCSPWAGGKTSLLIGSPCSSGWSYIRVHKGRINWAQLVIKKENRRKRRKNRWRWQRESVPMDGGVWVGYDKDMLCTYLKLLGNEKNLKGALWCWSFRQWPCIWIFYSSVKIQGSAGKRSDPVTKK